MTTTSYDLIAGRFIDYTAVDQDTDMTAVSTTDKVKFLFIKNTSTADGIVICLDGGTAANDLADSIFIGPSQSWFGRLPNVTPTTAGAITVSVGDETAFGEAFQNLISLSAGSPNFFLWNEVDDSQTVTWNDVNPGSTD